MELITPGGAGEPGHRERDVDAVAREADRLFWLLRGLAPSETSERGAAGVLAAAACALDLTPAGHEPEGPGAAPEPSDEDALPTESEDDDPDLCAICLDPVEGADERGASRTLPCTHAFHVGCLTRWLQVRKTCPLCQRNVQLSRSAQLRARRRARNAQREEDAQREADAAQREADARRAAHEAWVQREVDNARRAAHEALQQRRRAGDLNGDYPLLPHRTLGPPAPPAPPNFDVLVRLLDFLYLGEDTRADTDTEPDAMAPAAQAREPQATPAGAAVPRPDEPATPPAGADDGMARPAGADAERRPQPPTWPPAVGQRVQARYPPTSWRWRPARVVRASSAHDEPLRLLFDGFMRSVSVPTSAVRVQMGRRSQSRSAAARRARHVIDPDAGVATGTGAAGETAATGQ